MFSPLNLFIYFFPFFLFIFYLLGSCDLGMFWCDSENSIVMTLTFLWLMVSWEIHHHFFFVFFLYSPFFLTQLNKRALKRIKPVHRGHWYFQIQEHQSVMFRQASVLWCVIINGYQSFSINSPIHGWHHVTLAS